MGRAKFRPPTSLASYNRANRSSAASVFPGPVSDSMTTNCSPNGACYVAYCMALAVAILGNGSVSLGTPASETLSRCAVVSKPIALMALLARSRAVAM